MLHLLTHSGLFPSVHLNKVARTRRSKILNDSYYPISSSKALVNYFSGNSSRSYHSYPDPKEKPRISNAVSGVKKSLDKNPFIKIDPNFRLDLPLPGMSKGLDMKDGDIPKTLSTTLSNGLVVASQDRPGLMSSFAFLANRGRYAHIIKVTKSVS